MTEKIVCLGWGSLVWESRNLEIPMDAWRRDGVLLPIEFSRISDNGRVTLIIDPEAAPQKVLWAEMKQGNLGDALEALMIREGAKNLKNIHYVQTQSPTETLNPVRRIIVDWMKEMDITTVIWTGLSYRLGVRPSETDIIRHLESLDEQKRMAAEIYVRRAPAQIDTAYRRAIVKHFNWHAQ